MKVLTVDARSKAPVRPRISSCTAGSSLSTDTMVRLMPASASLAASACVRT